MAVLFDWIKWRHFRWYHWCLAGSILIYGFYIGVSYFYLPGKLKQLVQENGSELIGRSIQVGRIDFNPFRLSLTVSDFAVDDQPDHPLVAWQKLYVNINCWRSLFRWGLTQDAFMLEAFQINIQKRQEGFNFIDIIDRFSSQEKNSSEKKSGIALEIDKIELKNGKFHFIDLSGKKPASSKLDNINLTFQNFYLATGAENLNPFDVEAGMPGGGTLHIKGNYRIDPLYVEATLQGKEIQLAAYSEFLENVIPVSVRNGLLSMEAGVLISGKDEVQVELKNGTIAVVDLAVDDAAKDPPMLRAKSMRAEGLSLDLRNRRILVDQVFYNGIVAHQWLDENGVPRFRPLLVQKIQRENIGEEPLPEKPADLPEGSGPSWDIRLKRFQAGGSHVYFADKRPGIDANHDLDIKEVFIQDLTFMPNKTTTFSASAVLNEKGKVEVKGSMTLVPFTANFDCQMQKLDLARFSGYVEASTHMRVEDGDLDLNGKVQMTSKGNAPTQIMLNVLIDKFEGRDSRNGSMLVTFPQLTIDEFLLDTEKQALTIKDVKLTKPELFVELNKDRQLNLATLSKPPQNQQPLSGHEATTREEGEPDRPWNIQVAEFKMDQGVAHFRDRSVAPVFESGLYGMNMQIRNLNSSQNGNATFALDSKIDRYAPFEVTGTLAPLPKQPEFTFTSRLKGLELSSLSAYSGIYVGYGVNSGKLNLNLDYELKHRKLHGQNQIIADQLFLGDAVQSDQAVKAPVKLGLALLRDVNGVIDIDVGVLGDLDDPGFSVAGVIAKAIINVLTKAAAAPFQMLGSLAGGRKDLGEVVFEEGESALDKENQDRLGQLANALKKRSQLTLVVQGNSSPEKDKTAIQQKLVMSKVSDHRNVPVTASKPAEWLLEKENRDELEKINSALKLKNAFERKEEIKALDPGLTDEMVTQKAYEQMFADVCERQSVSDQDLIALADQRALSIKQYLIEKGQLGQERISLKKATPGAINGLIIRLALEAR